MPDLKNLIKSGDSDPLTIELVKSSSLLESKHLDSKLDSQISDNDRNGNEPTLLNNSKMVSVVQVSDKKKAEINDKSNQSDL